MKVKLTNEEFLSGFRKTDKLIPIITVTVSLSEKSWDGPRSLYEMLDIRDEVIKAFIPDYKMNLISPVEMDDEEFAKFHTGLGFALDLIKHQKKGAEEAVKRLRDRKIDRETAVFLNNAMELKLEYQEANGGINMIEAFRLKEEKDINRGRREGRREGREQNMLQVYRNCMKRGMDKEDAIAISGITKSVLKKNNLL